MVVGRRLSYWEGNFSGAMLNFGRVSLTVLFLTKNAKWHVDIQQTNQGICLHPVWTTRIRRQQKSDKNKPLAAIIIPYGERLR